jgi:undecaprenyl-diphosphatase
MTYVLTQTIVQALTEFLPVSSSGHLLITKHLFNLSNPGLILDVTLHLGTAICMVIYIGRHRSELFRDKASLKQLTLYALIATAVTGVMGVVLAPYVRGFYSLGWLALNYLVMAVLLVSSRWMYGADDGSQRGLSRLTLPFVIAIGVIQAVALFPGISRSGITIIGMMALGFAPLFAFMFSFLVAIPTILAAGGYEFLSAYQVGAVFDFPQLLIGFFAVIILGYPVLVLLRTTIQRRLFHLFSIYCFMISGILFWVTRL